jgi:hypothetical protein
MSLKMLCPYTKGRAGGGGQADSILMVVVFPAPFKPNKRKNRHVRSQGKAFGRPNLFLYSFVSS